MKALGLEIVGSNVYWVMLEGSPKAYNVKAFGCKRLEGGEANIEPDGLNAENYQPEGESFNQVPLCNRIGLALSSRNCVLREILIPFAGREEIRKTLKFEAEGYFQSHPIEELIVDAMVVSEGEAETKLFVAGCPKEALGSNLEDLKGLGIDPERVSLDMELLIKATLKLGGVGLESPESFIVLSLDLDQTLIGLIVDGEFRSFRSVRFGLNKVVNEIYRKTGEDKGSIREVLLGQDGKGKSLEKQKGQLFSEGNSDQQVILDNGDSEQLVEPEEGQRVYPSRLLEEAFGVFCFALRKEIVRFLAAATEGGGTPKIYVSGAGAIMKGLVAQLESVLETRCQSLNLFESFGYNRFLPEYEKALSASLAELGSIVPETNFRQEEFAFKRKFDKLKSPLAVFAFLVLILLLYMDLNVLRGRRMVEEAIGVKVVSKKKGGRVSRQLPRYSGLLAQIALPDPRSGHIKAYLPGRVSKNILSKIAKSEPEKRVRVLLEELKKYRKSLENKTGYFPELKLESGLAVMVWFSEIIKRAGGSPILNNFLVTSLDLKVGVKKSSRYLDAKLVFRGEDFREKAAEFMKILAEFCQNPQSPFAKFEEKGGGKPFQGTIEPGAIYVFRLVLKEEIPVDQDGPQ